MTIDSSLCIVPPNKRKIWTDPQRFWTRDPGNCNLANDVNGFDFIKSLQINQEKFKNLVLENKVPPIGGSGPMSNVDGRLKKTSFYNYLSKVKSNPHHRYQTYAVQRQNGTYTNPNTQSAILKIGRINNIPAFLTCKEKNTDSNLTPPSPVPVPPPIPPPPAPGSGVNLVTGVPDLFIYPMDTTVVPFPVGFGIVEGTYNKILSVNGLTGTITNAKELKGYRFTVSYLPELLHSGLVQNPPFLWTLGGEIYNDPSTPEILLNVTSGGYPNLATVGDGKSVCDNGVDKTCYTLLFYPPTIPILPTPPNTGPNTVDQITFYAIEPSSDQTFMLGILLSDYQRILDVNQVNDASDLTAYRFKGSKDDNIEWMLNGSIKATGTGTLGPWISLGVTSGPKVEAKPEGNPYTLTFYPRLR
jgi:hypothetical protein